MALRDNTNVWIAGNDGRLDIRKVETIWRDADVVLLRENLQPGERLVISDLAAPADQMPVKIEDSHSENHPTAPVPKAIERIADK